MRSYHFNKWFRGLGVFLGMSCIIAHAQQAVIVKMHAVTDEGVGELIGTIRLENSRYGLLLHPDIKGLEPGPHGFHLHQHPNCGVSVGKDGIVTPGGAAGGHFDPLETGRHAGPYATGHLGDLPVLMVNPDRTASIPLLAPRLMIKDLRKHALIVHVRSDNYSDDPKPLGGGGPRAGCGVIR